jgi:hypothetical protein
VGVGAPIPALKDNGCDEIAEILSQEQETLRLCGTGCAQAG